MADSKTQIAADVSPVKSIGTINITFGLQEFNGNVQIYAQCTNGVVPYHTYVKLFTTAKSSSQKSETVKNGNALQTWNTDKPWGSGYFATLVIKDASGSGENLAQTFVTQ